MAFCANCGGPLGESQQFCPSCGRPVGQVAGAAASYGVNQQQSSQGQQPPPQAPPQTPNQYPQQYGQQYGQQYPQQDGGQHPPAYQQNWGAPPQKSRKGLWIGLAVLLLAIIVACVLVFVVFYDDIFKGGDASTPEGAVTKLLSAMEDQDIDAVFEVLDVSGMIGTVGEDYVDLFKDSMAAEMFADGAVSFSGVKMETTQTSPTTATVAIVEGRVTFKYESGETETQDVRDAEEPVSFELTKKDGAWYVDASTFDF